MKDEYGNMDASGETYVAEQFTTEFGCVYVYLFYYRCTCVCGCVKTQGEIIIIMYKNYEMTNQCPAPPQKTK